MSGITPMKSCARGCFRWPGRACARASTLPPPTTKTRASCTASPRFRGRDIISYTAEVAPLAKSLGVATENSTYTTKFASRADLETVFAALAAKLPVDASDKVMIDGVEVKLGRFVTYDPAVPAEREEAREMLSKYGDN